MHLCLSACRLLQKASPQQHREDVLNMACSNPAPSLRIAEAVLKNNKAEDSRLPQMRLDSSWFGG